jgi:hypothetical protein
MSQPIDFLQLVALHGTSPKELLMAPYITEAMIRQSKAADMVGHSDGV